METSLFPTSLDSSNLYEVVARLSTTLTADIDATTTTIPLASTTGFPTKGYIVIDNETIAYTSVSVGSVDATGGRGHAGTAASHTNTTQVLVAVTAAVFNKLRAGMIAVQTKVGISGSTDTNSHDYKLSGVTGSAKAVTGLSSKIITATRDLAAASGDVSYTGVGFQPTSLICFSYIIGGQIGSWGFADSGKTGQDVTRKTSTGIFASYGVFIAIEPVADNIQYAIVKSYDADGFTLTWSKANSPTGTVTIRFLCFR